jgi:hypothetical protein
MKGSPFIYGSTVSAHAFTNREAEMKKLSANLLTFCSYKKLAISKHKTVCQH